MKKFLALLISLVILFSLVGCTPGREKAAEFMITRGEPLGSKYYISSKETGLHYESYFLIYDPQVDNFYIESYTSDKYYKTPPTSQDEVKSALTINLSSGYIKYYNYPLIYGNTDIITAYIDFELYSSSNQEMSIVKVQTDSSFPALLESTFTLKVYNTLKTIKELLAERDANFSLRDLGFEAF